MTATGGVPNPESVRVGDRVAYQLRPGRFMRGYVWSLYGDAAAVEWPDGTGSVVPVGRLVAHEERER